MAIIVGVIVRITSKTNGKELKCHFDLKRIEDRFIIDHLSRKMSTDKKLSDIPF